MAKQVLSDLDFNSASRILNLPDPTLAQHPATKAYVDAAIEGLNWKDDVKVASQANINLSSPGATIDGITMVPGDRVLIKEQTDPIENGIYIWNGAATPMTRSADANLGEELNQAVIVVREGTSAGVSYRQTTVDPTLGVSSVVFTPFGVVAPPATESTAGIAEIATQTEVNTGTDDERFVTPLKLANWAGKLGRFSQSVGDGSSTQYDVTHNLGSRDVQVEVYRNSGSYDKVMVETSHLDTNTVRLNFAVAPTSNQFRVVVHY